jgi:cation transport protein ChaC
MLFDTSFSVADPTADPSPDQPRGTPVWSSDIAIPVDAELWVFAYGSLMWNPGFPVSEAQPAVLRGYHRRFCVSSARYRGTPERPGLVLGLDRGGSCRGVAFRVAADHVPGTLDYLWEREMSIRSYRPKLLPVRLRGEGPASVSAVTFVVDRRHRQYCGGLGEADMIERIAGCRGERGPNIEYLANTVAHLEALGIRDERVFRLYDEVRRRVA